MKDWIRVDIRFPGDLPLPSGEMAGLLFRSVSGLMIHDDPPGVSLFLPAGGPDLDLAGLAAGAKALGLSWPGWPHEYVEFRRVGNQDWGESWRDNFSPLRAGGLLILPQWEDPGDYSDQTILRIYPGMAFGTGDHPTTQGCLEAISQILSGGNLPPQPRILDVGTGSGILALAALTLSRGKAWGLDADPLALDNARHNASLNDLDHKLCLVEGSFPQALGPLGRFDLVVSNLDRHQLVVFACQMTDCLRPGGYLVLSGFTRPYCEKVERAFTALGLQSSARLDREEWAVLVLRVPA